MLKDLEKKISDPGSNPSVVPLRPAQTTIRSPGPARSDIGLVQRTAKPMDTVLTCRYEMKYYIHESTARAVMGFVQNLLPFDRYSKNGAYPIATLYLDSHNLQLCRESLEGHKNRFKLRIRSYSDDPAHPCFFEIKRRMNSICLKDRARVSQCHCASLLSLNDSPSSQVGGKDLVALNQFLLYTRNINAAPVLKVRYMRHAFEDSSHNRVRVTFDRRLAFKVVKTVDVSWKGDGWQSHNDNGVVLEIKFTGHYPAWLSEMVKMFDLNRQSFSKYARAVEQSCLMRYCAPQMAARIHK